jgi:NAD(P)-dependent dehydrogenase (short-subunit alcohol dehydrogenase family)
MNQGELNGKVAIVTGAAQGIGESIATFLARDGAAVMIADLQEEKARAVAERLNGEGLNAAATRVDVADPAAARAMAAATIERFGQVDILVNDAGLDAPRGNPWELTEEHWRRVIDVNLSGQWWCTQAVIPHMMERRFGRIIFISSVSAKIGREGLSVAYNATKSGLIGLTVGLSVQLETYGIRVNAITPGPTGTGPHMTPESFAAIRARLPLGPGGPEPVAQACVYLCRSSGDWISGSVLNVSGGSWRGL